MYISLRRQGCSLANVSTISCEQTGTSLWMCISAKDVRRSLPHVDLKYVLIRFKVLNDLSLEQLVTGNVQDTSNNTRMSGYRLIAHGSACDGEVGRQALQCCSICCCHLIFQLTTWWDTLSGDARSSSYRSKQIMTGGQLRPGRGGGLRATKKPWIRHWVLCKTTRGQSPTNVSLSWTTVVVACQFVFEAIRLELLSSGEAAASKYLCWCFY